MGKENNKIEIPDIIYRNGMVSDGNSLCSTVHILGIHIKGKEEKDVNTITTICNIKMYILFVVSYDNNKNEIC